MEKVVSRGFVRVDVPFRLDSVVSWRHLRGLRRHLNPTSLWSCVSARVNVPIQLTGIVVKCSFLFSWLWPPRAISLYFFCYINRNALVERCSLKKKDYSS